MAKLLVALGLVLTLTFISVNALSLPDKVLNNARIKFVTSEEMKKLLKENPNFVELSRIIKPETQETKESAVIAPRYTIEYFIGSRTSRDWRVAHDAQSHYYAQPRDVQMTLDYPASGTGRIVTFVDIFVSQSSLLGRAYVISGGIGYRYITIIVEADNTYYFDHDASIYGQD